jgi:hypothetical protein
LPTACHWVALLRAPADAEGTGDAKSVGWSLTFQIRPLCM